MRRWITALGAVALLMAAAPPATADGVPYRYSLCGTVWIDQFDPKVRALPGRHRCSIVAPPSGRQYAFPNRATARPSKLFTSPYGYAFINTPLCSREPTVVFGTMRRWGAVFHRNKDGYRDRIEEYLLALIMKNCAPGTVRSVRIYGWWDARFCNDPAQRRLRGNSKTAEKTCGRNPYPYSGRFLVETGEWRHDDTGGWDHYIRTGGARLEGGYERTKRQRQIIRQWRNAPDDWIEFCERYPKRCAQAAKTILLSTLEKRRR